MTIPVEHPGFIARLACPTCMCDITILDSPTWLAYDMEQTKLQNAAYTDNQAGYRPLQVDEPPAYAPKDCGCRCHETARQFLANVYDPR